MIYGDGNSKAEIAGAQLNLVSTGLEQGVQEYSDKATVAVMEAEELLLAIAKFKSNNTIIAD